MSNRPRALVMQQGGSTREWYTTTYNSMKDANKAVKSHEDAGYTAIALRIPPVLAKALCTANAAESQFIGFVEDIAKKCVKIA